MAKNKKALKIYTLCVIVTSLGMVLLYYYNKIVPFGNNTLASADANIQYLDFFLYQKDVLKGKNSAFYSFSTGLGQNQIGLYAYYLMSPINLLLVLCPKNQIMLFFNVLIVIKITLSSFTMAYYLQKRFARINHWFPIVPLACSYAFMQYNIAQSGNIMWLDGVYILPLILLGVYYVIYYNKILALSVFVGISIIVQWYTGGINCIFACGWFVFEIIIYALENGSCLKSSLYKTVLFVKAMALGVLLSAWIFLPNVLNLLEGKGNVDHIFQFQMRGNPVSSILNYSIGGMSTPNSVSLYAGMFVLLSIFGLFCLKCITLKKKVLYFCFIVLAIAIFYWQPFFALFSLFKSADSYWYRYSYISVFLLIFLAAEFWANWEYKEKVRFLYVLTFLFCCALLCLNLFYKTNNWRNILYTCCIALIVGFLIVLMNTDKQRKYVAIVLSVLVLFDLFFNANALIKIYQRSDADIFKAYNTKQQRQIADIKKMDKTTYRISQTVPRRSVNNTTANYNESMAFDYWGIASYTSCPQNTQLNFLNKLGYKNEGNCMTIVNTSILPVDSLLGAKYIISPYRINGCEKLKDISISESYLFSMEGENTNKSKKEVYYNPYALPLGIVYKDNDLPLNNRNSFEYINSIYKHLSGIDEDVFREIKAVKSKSNEKNLRYDFYNLSEDEVLYGNVCFDDKCVADVNGIYLQDYSCWKAPSVLMIPHKNNNAYIAFNSEANMNPTKESFYLMNLQVLKQMTDNIKANQELKLKIQNGYIVCDIEHALENENLLLSVMVDNGWEIKQNGVVITPEKFADAMVQIPLKRGENHIEMRYIVPGMKKGIIISIIGFLVLIINIFKENRQKEKRR